MADSDESGSESDLRSHSESDGGVSSTSASSSGFCVDALDRDLHSDLSSGSSSEEDRPPLDQATRQDRVLQLHSLGLSCARIARRVHVHRNTVRADLAALGLLTWSSIDDDALEAVVRSIIANTHRAIGVGLTEGHLLTRGLRVQRCRIRAALARCADIRRPRAHHRFKRRSYFNAKGPMNLACMDQNEKLGIYGIKFLMAVCAFARYPLHWMLVTSLRGIEHSRLYHEMLWRRGEVRASDAIA